MLSLASNKTCGMVNYSWNNIAAGFSRSVSSIGYDSSSLQRVPDGHVLSLVFAG